MMMVSVSRTLRAVFLRAAFLRMILGRRLLYLGRFRGRGYWRRLRCGSDRGRFRHIDGLLLLRLGSRFCCRRRLNWCGQFLFRHYIFGNGFDSRFFNRCFCVRFFSRSFFCSRRFGGRFFSRSFFGSRRFGGCFFSGGLFYSRFLLGGGFFVGVSCFLCRH